MIRWGYSLVGVRGLLTAVASLVVEHRLQVGGLSSCGFQMLHAVAQGAWLPRSLQNMSSRTKARTREPWVYPLPLPRLLKEASCDGACLVKLVLMLVKPL